MRFRNGLTLALVALSACALPEDRIPHDDPQLPLTEGRRVDVRSDLPADLLPAVVGRLDALEEILDVAFPFLVAPAGRRPVTLVLGDPGRFGLSAREHGVKDEAADAFVCREGELYLRYRPEDWAERWAVGPPYPLEPRVRPLAAATMSRRVVTLWGELEPTWLEAGLQQVFVDLAAQEFGDEDLALRQRRERLLDAYLPLYLGAAPVLVEVVEHAKGSGERRTGSQASAWAVVGYLLAEPDRTAILGSAFRRAAGSDVDASGWEEALHALRAKEEEFERYLQGAVLRELLATFLDAPSPVDRWESAAALRLLANLDIDAEADDETRRRLVGAAAQLLEEEPTPVRFLDEFASDLARVRGARSRLQAQRRLQRIVKQEFDRRSAGYGHPAVEVGRREMGRALRRALERE